MAAITTRVRDALTSRLITAWSNTVDEMAPSYPDLAPDEVEALRSVDWTGAVRPQFFSGNFDLTSIEDADDLTWPVAILRVTEARNEGTTKFREFSGTVTAALELVLQWPTSSPPAASVLRVVDLAVDVFYRLFHAYAWVGGLTADGIAYSGDATVILSPLVAGDDWRQSVTAEFQFGVDV